MNISLFEKVNNTLITVASFTTAIMFLFFFISIAGEPQPEDFENTVTPDMTLVIWSVITPIVSTVMFLVIAFRDNYPKVLLFISSLIQIVVSSAISVLLIKLISSFS